MIRAERTGFSLLELMIVVMIIGILATAAMPQYNKVLDRVREAEGVGNLGSLLTAQYVHFLEHGQFATNGSQLLIVSPDLNHWSIPGGSATSTWTATPTSAQIIFSSRNHGHADPDTHQLRGTAKSDGTFTIEARRPGSGGFVPL